MAVRSIALALAAALSAAIAGCAAKPATVVAPAAAISPPSFTTEVIGRSVEGRPIECITLDARPAGIGLTVMLIATIHGDEAAGTPLLQRLLREAQADPPPPWLRDRQIVVIPIANPDGFVHDRRGNTRGIDLNRNFPAASFTSRKRHGSEPLSEPESRALHEAILAARPDRIISIHQPLACIDYDGPGEQLAAAMAGAMPIEHRLPVKKLGAYPGSLGAFAGEDLATPIITIELPGAASRLTDDELWIRYGPMIIAAVETT